MGPLVPSVEVLALMSNSLHSRIVEFMMDRFYGSPLIANRWRGDYVEIMIHFALGEEWQMTAEWNGWDLQKADVRLEIKQSAGLQTWGTSRKSPRFNIERKSGYYKNETDWIALPGRHADIYIFAWQPETERDVADHRCADRWRFYIVPEHELPEDQKSIGLSPVKKLSEEFSYGQLAEAIDSAVDALPSGKGERR